MELKLEDDKKESVFTSVLLIVPYGIETEMFMFNPGKEMTFNRTLWN